MRMISTWSGPQLLRTTGKRFCPVQVPFGIRVKAVDAPVESGRQPVSTKPVDEPPSEIVLQHFISVSIGDPEMTIRRYLDSERRIDVRPHIQEGAVLVEDLNPTV